MPRRPWVAPSVLTVSALLTALLVAACTGDPPPPVPLASENQPFTIVMPMPTETIASTTEADATQAVRATRMAATGDGTPAPMESLESALPADLEAVVLQIARIDASPWEPEILADMAPELSIQANGFGVFRYVGGPSDSGWYQTVITPSLVLNLVQLLIDDVDLADLAEQHGVAEARFETGRDGQPAGTGPVYVVYARSADGEERLVLPEKVLSGVKPTDTDAGRLSRLREVLEWVDVWRSGVVRPLAPGVALLGLDRMGWWSEIRQPYSPTSAVAFGTLARSRVPSGAPVAAWPAEQPLAGLVEATYGTQPDEFRIAGDDLAGALAAAMPRDLARASLGNVGDGGWGPLWRDTQGAVRYLLGVRPSVPGGNHTVIDYTYEVPKRGIGLATPTP